MADNTIGLWLRDTYSRIQPEPIWEYDGPKEVNDLTELSAEFTVYGNSPDKNNNPIVTGSKHFLKTNNLLGYILRNKEKSKSKIVTIVIPTLRNIYWKHRDLLSDDDRKLLKIIMSSPSPSFYNIFDYKKLQQYQTQVNVQEYQLIGQISQFDVLHFTVEDFLQQIQSHEPLQIELPIGLIIRLSSEDFDFWDDQMQKLLI